MNIKKWFLSKTLWLRGGIFGVIICIILFLFNTFVYFPLIDNIYGGNLPQWALIFPMLSGHLFPLFSGFIVPYGFLCKFTVPICTSWSAFRESGSVPWRLETGESGYCAVQTMTPTNACANLSEMIGFWGLAILLLAAYFILGAIIGRVIEKRRAWKIISIRWKRPGGADEIRTRISRVSSTSALPLSYSPNFTKPFLLIAQWN